MQNFITRSDNCDVCGVLASYCPGHRSLDGSYSYCAASERDRDDRLSRQRSRTFKRGTADTSED